MIPPMNMTIFVDADAFPRAAKEILLKTSARRNLPLVFVSNKPLPLPESPQVSDIIVPGGFNVADDKIVELAEAGDLVVTADIPLADRIVTKGAVALDPRGTLYTEENVKQLLAMRNLMDEIRSAGEITGGPPPYGPKDREAFANQLDRFLNRRR